MTYREFRNTYHWTLKTYPNTDRFYTDDMEKQIGTCETIRYEKVGNRWHETGRETEPMCARFYMNCVDAVPFFRRCCGIERVEMAYTPIGYLPIQISSTSPMRDSKVVRKFSF